jgi:hypothetical protein
VDMTTILKYLKEIGVEVDWVQLVHDEVQCQAGVNTVMNLRFPDMGNVLLNKYLLFRSNFPMQGTSYTFRSPKLYFMCLLIGHVTHVPGDWLRAGRPEGGGSWSPGRVKNFHFSISSRPALGSTQPPIK